MQNFDPQNLSEDVLELLDLYVIGALDENENAQVENILSVSMVAQTYVEEGRNALTLLETDSPSDASLFESIKDQIAAPSKISSISDAPSVVAKSRYPKILSFAVAASLVAVFVSLSLFISSTNGDDKKNMKAQLSAFAKADSTKAMDLQGAGNDKVALMMNSKGEVMLDGRTLSKLSKYETYQLWAIIEDSTKADGVKIISASVLGSSPDIFMTHVDGKVKGFAITKEVAGGVSSSSNEPMFAHMIA